MTKLEVEGVCVCALEQWGSQMLRFIRIAVALARSLPNLIVAVSCLLKQITRE